MIRWARRRDGAVIHDPECRYAAAPWLWADDMDAMRLFQYVRDRPRLGLRFCATCCSGLAEAQREGDRRRKEGVLA